MPPICPKIRENTEHCAAAVPLALHIMGRPCNSTDPIPCDDLLSLKKLAGEGRMEEVKIILGWEIHMRKLMIALPEFRYVAWS